MAACFDDVTVRVSVLLVCTSAVCRRSFGVLVGV